MVAPNGFCDARWLFGSEISRHSSSIARCVSLLIVTVALVTFLQPSRAKAEALLEVGSLRDRELATALEAAFDLPTRLAFLTGESDRIGALQAEQDKLIELQRMFGYLDATVDVDTSGGANTTQAGDSERTHGDAVLLRPVPGPLYHLGSVEVQGLAGRIGEATEQDIADLLTPVPGSPARADIISKLQDEITYRVESDSFPFARVVKCRIVPDDWPEMVRVEIEVDTGPAARLGAVSFDGLLYTDPEFLAEIVPFSEGDPYAPQKIEELRNRLHQSGLFRTARVELGSTPGPSGLVPVTVKVHEVLPDAILHPSFAGMATVGAAIAFVALRQLVIAGGVSRRRYALSALNVAVMLLVASAGALALQRILLFLNIG